MRLPRLVVVVAVVLAGGIGVATAASRTTGGRAVHAASASTDPPGEFFAVSCAGPSFCLAVGTAAASWDGHRWHMLPMPAQPPSTVNVFMDAVSCPAANDCVAVGDFDSATAPAALAEHWNGSKWTALSVGTNTGADLEAVSCPTVNWCMAAGSTDDHTTHALAGIWNGPSGGDWRVTASPNVAGAASNEFRKLSCASATVCVGLASSVDAWSGSSWRTLQTGRYAVGNVSCLPGDGVDDCTYLGFYGSGTTIYSDTLEHGGTGWHYVGSIHGEKLAGNPAAYACAPASSCQAVGQQTDHAGGDVIAYAQHWNGTTWVDVPTVSPNPPHQGLEYDAFFGVACVTAKDCFAVGRANGDVLAERWDGRRWILGSFIALPAKDQEPGPPPLKTQAPWFVLADEWNQCDQCHGEPLPDLLSPVIANYYLKLLETTERELDTNGAGAVSFFRALTSDGLGHFGYASLKLGIGQGIIAGFPGKLVPASQPDGIQVLGVAIASGRMSPAEATQYTLALIDHTECPGCQPSLGWGLSSPSLAAEDLVFNWLHGQLLSASPSGTEAQLLNLGITTPDGWSLVTVGAEAVAIATAPPAAVPTLKAMNAWIGSVKNEVMNPIVHAEGKNFVAEAQQNAHVGQETFAGWTGFVTGAVGIAFPPVGVLAAGAGLVLGLWGAEDTSGIPAGYDHGISDSVEAPADADLFCIQALLNSHRIIPAAGGSALPDNVDSLRRVWEDYVTPSGANGGYAYVMNVKVSPDISPGTVPLADVGLGVASFMSTS